MWCGLEGGTNKGHSLHPVSPAAGSGGRQEAKLRSPATLTSRAGPGWSHGSPSKEGRGKRQSPNRRLRLIHVVGTYFLNPVSARYEVNIFRIKINILVYQWEIEVYNWFKMKYFIFEDYHSIRYEITGVEILDGRILQHNES